MREARLNSPPEDVGWTWLTVELLSSDAWRGLSINARRFVDFLLIEHINHAGAENGFLMATHEQLAKDARISKGSIKAAILEAQRAGIVDARRAHRMPTVFRLTFYAAKGVPADNRWKRVRTDQRAKRRPPNLTPKCGGLTPPKSGVIALPIDEETAEIRGATSVGVPPKSGVLLYLPGGDTAKSSSALQIGAHMETTHD